jgi:hypothetical protein
MQIHDLFCTQWIVQAVGKTGAAPIERVKLMMQNQTEMVRHYLNTGGDRDLNTN